jgi:hypothetical protein
MLLEVYKEKGENTNPFSHSQHPSQHKRERLVCNTATILDDLLDTFWDQRMCRVRTEDLVDWFVEETNEKEKKKKG